MRRTTGTVPYLCVRALAKSGKRLRLMIRSNCCKEWSTFILLPLQQRPVLCWCHDTDMSDASHARKVQDRRNMHLVSEYSRAVTRQF